MKVAELDQKIQAEKVAIAQVEKIELGNDGLRVPGLSDVLVFDEWAQKKVGGFLGIPPKYIQKCPNDLRNENVNFWLRHGEAQEAYVHYRDDSLLGIYPNSESIVTHSDMARTFLERFDGQDDVREFHNTPEVLQIDVTRPELNVNVPIRDRLNQGIDPQVGDITDGGIRLVTYAPNDNRRPFVQYYLHRLVCSNGMSIEEPTARFYGKGKTRVEIITSLGEVVEEMLAQVPSKLDDYASLDGHLFDGDVTMLISRLAAEHGLANRVTNALIENAATVPDSPSLYDIANVFTYTANHVLRGTKHRLQSLGGWITETPQNIIHRCTKCEQVLSR